MSEKERLDILRNVKELSTADGTKLRSLLPFFDEVEMPAGVAVARESRLCHEYFVVASGQLEICRRGRATVLGRGGSFGWTPMRVRGRHDATVVTLSPVQLLVMSHSQFRAAEALALAN